jgi:tRNA U34 5-carboxymethylaminomethyl modifying GTPase MnmE/TrmE
MSTAIENRPAEASTHDEEADISEFRKMCPQFRVLIVGRANSGKTTILKKMCDAAAEEKPIVRDKSGTQVMVL